MFQEAVEKRMKDPQGKLTRLINLTSGEVKELVKPCQTRMWLCKCYDTSGETIWESTQATSILQEGDYADDKNQAW